MLVICTEALTLVALHAPGPRGTFSLSPCADEGARRGAGGFLWPFFAGLGSLLVSFVCRSPPSPARAAGPKFRALFTTGLQRFGPEVGTRA